MQTPHHKLSSLRISDKILQFCIGVELPFDIAEVNELCKEVQGSEIILTNQ